MLHLLLLGIRKVKMISMCWHPDPVTAPVVQLIFELAIKGMKYTEIANYLNDNGYDSIFEYYQKDWS